jgi:hypothetical protein
MIRYISHIEPFLDTKVPLNTMDESSTIVVSVPMILSWSNDGKRVSILGTFNDWKEKIPLTKT